MTSGLCAGNGASVSNSQEVRSKTASMGLGSPVQASEKELYAGILGDDAFLLRVQP